jgi:hypothetical protein
MNNLFGTAFEMTEHLKKVTDDVNAFISFAKNSTLVDPQRLDHSKVKVP